MIIGTILYNFIFHYAGEICMKLVTLSLTLVGVCFLNNSYAMQNDAMVLTSQEKLSEARRLVGESNKVLDNKEKYLRVAFFLGDGARNYAARENAKALDFANQANSLAFEVMNDKAVELTTKQDAENLYQQMEDLGKTLSGSVQHQ